MESVGIRELRQNASQVVARAAAGEVITITDRGRPVAQMSPLANSSIERLRERGLITPPTRTFEEYCASTKPTTGPPLSPVLQQLRDEERY
jgi:hypothetical protein